MFSAQHSLNLFLKANETRKTLADAWLIMRFSFRYQTRLKQFPVERKIFIGDCAYFNLWKYAINLFLSKTAKSTAALTAARLPLLTLRLLFVFGNCLSKLIAAFGRKLAMSFIILSFYTS
jgi:hypothetical protein